MTALAYRLQEFNDGFRSGSTLIRERDGAELAYDYGESEDRTLTRDFLPLIRELNSVAAENERLRCARDAVTLELKREIESLRAQLSRFTTESRGQMAINWPAIQY